MVEETFDLTQTIAGIVRIMMICVTQGFSLDQH